MDNYVCSYVAISKTVISGNVMILMFSSNYKCMCHVLGLSQHVSNHNRQTFV